MEEKNLVVLPIQLCASTPEDKPFPSPSSLKKENCSSIQEMAPISFFVVPSPEKNEKKQSPLDRPGEKR